MKNVIDWYKKFHRLNNYVSASMLYLKENQLLEEELKPEHIKDRLLGHWGTVPGLNFIYAGLNYIISTQHKDVMFIVGPGHGAPGVLSNVFFERTLSEYYDNISFDKKGLSNLIKDFSWPYGFPSHITAGVPGSILEGGELGYSLGVAYGAVFDNPELIAACVVGDGEAETGTLAASWHSNKFLNSKRDGIVLPILHLNGYKISTPTIFGSMSKVEITEYFRGLGYDPLFVSQYDSLDIYSDFLSVLESSFKKIEQIKRAGNFENQKPPVIILKTKKGWSGPDKVHGEKIEDNNLSHGIPLKNPKSDEDEFKALKNWLESYKLNELFDGNWFAQSLFEFIPKNTYRMGVNIYTMGKNKRSDLKLPELKDYDEEFNKPGKDSESRMKKLSIYLRDVFKLNKESKNFRLFSPDESESNMLETIFEETGRAYSWPLRQWDENMNPNGRMMEILSENVLQAWMQGYNLTGRHGLFISYEAFFNIISSQIDQYIKYLKQWQEFSWRPKLPSMNYLATSTIWRQEHNGFTHQNPSLISNLLTKQFKFVNVYFPADVNTLLVTMEDCLKRKNCVNLIIADKRELPQWLSLEEAKKHVAAGISVWDWAGSDVRHQISDIRKGDKNKIKLNTNLQSPISNLHDEVDVVLASAGDFQTLETLAAITLLKEMAPELKFRYVNVNEITMFGFGDENRPLLDDEQIEKYFTKDRDVVINFHGYPEVIKQLTWGHALSFRLKILGYREEGSTTTPFDMQVRNGTDRFSVAMHAIESASKFNPKVEENKTYLIDLLRQKLKEHKKYIIQNGDDMPEVKNWRWK